LAKSYKAINAFFEELKSSNNDTTMDYQILIYVHKLSSQAHFMYICILQTASNLATGYSKSQKEKNSNSKYAVWAAEQIIDKYQVRFLFCITVF
jgi:hypothetical protein